MSTTQVQTQGLRAEILDLLGEHVEVVARADGLAALMPVDYPDGDGVVVEIVPTAHGFTVSDGGNGDARLIVAGPGRKALGPVAAGICRRHGAQFDAGRVIARLADPRDLAGACWGVAQASVAIAEAATYHRGRAPKERELADLVAASARARKLDVELGRELEGASGHRHTATLYLPQRETVLEPIGGEQAWNAASAAYVKFADLRQVNGYDFVAVLDDRVGRSFGEAEGLLRQVAVVATWSRLDEWLDSLGEVRPR